MNSDPHTPTIETEAQGLSQVLVPLFKGVVYQENDPKLWQTLLSLQSRIRDYVEVLGLALMLDEAEGFAYLRSKTEDEFEGVAAPPRLITRRQLSFPVSLILALLRKRLAEFDASGGESRLILTLEELTSQIRLFLPDSANEVKVIDRIAGHVNKIVELGFLRRLKGKGEEAYEVRRILKAFVDAQWLSEFDARLEEYRNELSGDASPDDGEEDA